MRFRSLLAIEQTLNAYSAETQMAATNFGELLAFVETLSETHTDGRTDGRTNERTNIHIDRHTTRLVSANFGPQKSSILSDGNFQYYHRN